MPGFVGDPPVVVPIVFCESLSRSVGPDGRMTLVNTWEELNFPTFPSSYPFFALVTLSGIMHDFDAQFRIARPMDDMTEETADFGTPIRVVVPANRRPTNFGMQALGQFNGAGRYEMRLYGPDNTLMALKPFYVNQVILQQLPPQGA